MKNALKSRSKKSKIELQTNWYIILTVLIQFVVCISAAAYNCIWVKSKGLDISYLGYDYSVTNS